MTPGRARDPVQRTIEKGTGPLCVRISRPRHADAKREDLSGVESWIGPLQSEQALDEERRRHEQHERQRGFEDEQRRLQPARAAAGAPCRRGEGPSEIVLRAEKRRRQAEHEDGHERQPYGECEDAPVNPHVDDRGQLIGEPTRRRAEHGDAKQAAEHGGRRAQQEAFSQQLADQPAG